MARKVFFSFAYDDVKNFKVNVVRQSWLLNKENTFVDGSIWETAKKKDPESLKKLINEGLNNTSVTTVLIGEDTANRTWVNYEIIKSFDRGNGILGIHINRIKGRTGLTTRGQNPLDRLGLKIAEDGSKIYFFELLKNKWVPYNYLPVINNKQSNTIYFGDSWWSGNQWGESFRFSELFETYCWAFNEGYTNFSDWVEAAAKQAGR
ncbi:MAG TPA: TIR domain-containing protein [Flavobacteriales bacterium]|nr:TIR domain-containing protein [Flavobacteriales bacterium]